MAAAKKRTRKRSTTSRRRRAGTTPAWRAAMAAGQSQAELVIQAQTGKQRSRRRLRGPGPGLIVAEGDSWFDYPFFDVLEEMEDTFDYSVEAVAHRGDRVEGMAYDPGQLDSLWRLLVKLARDKRVPKVILLSGGGNDIAGEEFAMVLNHKLSGLPALNNKVVEGLFDERLRFAIVTLANAVTRFTEAAFNKRIPMVIHGYDYPVPDGRGYLGGFSLLPGPWLEPGFRLKGYDRLPERVQIMTDIMDRFNAMLKTVANGPGLEHLHYCDLRGTLSNALPKAYKKWWNDELHPTEKGFELIAGRIDAAIASL